MKAVIADTNVVLVSVGAFEADGGCPTLQLKTWCVDLVVRLMRGELELVIDASREIVEEYFKKVPQFPLGQEFIKWLSQNIWTGSTVRRVAIRKNKSGYAEFPADPKLAEFDRSDRKFIAVAVADGGKSTICEATDGKWWKWAKALKSHGIRVAFGDEAFAKELCRKKNSCLGACESCDG